MSNNIVNLLHYEVYFKNISTGSPGLVHIMRDQSKEPEENITTYCGFTSWAGQNIIVDETDTFRESQICKKCFKAFKNSHP